MLTVAELAKSCNTSTTTIYRILKGVPNSSTKYLTKKHKGVTYLTAKGEKLIRERLKPVELVKQNEDTYATDLNTQHIEQSENTELLAHLRKQNELLLEELTKEREHSRQQAQSLAELSEKLTELTKNEQILMLQYKNTLLLSDERPPEELEGKSQNNKKTLWQRLFKAKKER